MFRLIKRKQLTTENGKKKPADTQFDKERSERAVLNARLAAINLELDNMSRGRREPFSN